MNSMPASSAIWARERQSAQLPDQRSGTRVTARPDEQFAPNRPSLSRFALYIAARSPLAIVRSITGYGFGYMRALIAANWAITPGSRILVNRATVFPFHS